MLNRSISKWALVLLFINGVIGAGIFGLPSTAFKAVGVYSIAAFFVCALAVFVIIYCFAEVSSRFDKTGGPYLYALSSFGKLLAFLTGWLMLVTRFVTYAALINLLVSYLSFFSGWFAIPSSRIITILSITILLAFINHIGIKNSTRVNNFLTVAKLLPILLFIIVGCFHIEPANFELKQAPGFSSFSSTVLVLIFAFGGFESVLVTSGEVKNPVKNLPFALLFSTLLIAVIYILIQAVSIGTLPALATSDKPLAEAASLFMGKTGATLIAIGALFSVMGTLNAVMLVGSRLPFAFGEEKQFPAVFSYVHPKFKTPTRSLVFFATVSILISITNSFLYAVTISAIARVMIYAVVCFALLRLRKKNTAQTGYFKIPYGRFFAIAGVLICAWLLSSSKLNELRDVSIAVGAGLLVYFIVELGKRKKRVASG